MKCEKCNVNEATVFVTKSYNGETMEMHLCDSCAKENESLFLDDGISFQQFLSGLLDNSKTNLTKNQSFTCKSCGMSIEDFKRNSLVGCAECYHSFEGYLKPIVKQLQSNMIHTGKRPSHVDETIKVKEKIMRLESELKIALMEENYEQAAILRDSIRELRGEGQL